MSGDKSAANDDKESHLSTASCASPISKQKEGRSGETIQRIPPARHERDFAITDDKVRVVPSHVA